ncbi:hypothetical protein [Clostridium estertheticum]|uniref:hypothetical protein n=1 Tax=Clostridium estertheticum TaxID=238834 RepID=UPI001CF334BE|nr:hypothetical protein [Clostridium estertheticum]MCB2360726.1 hypothetical protein [Clostridium estertheticum]
MTGGVESLIRQTLDGKGINLIIVIKDAGKGILTLGLFHGAGKLFKKASTFIKESFSKISSKILENTRITKIALNNMDMPKGVKLACGLGGGDSKVRKNSLNNLKRLILR